MKNIICNYCGKEAIWVNNKEIYGKSYGEKNQMAWLCKPCNAYVGCHNNSKKPLGILANKELREIKMISKKMWQRKYLSIYGKGKAYKYLAENLKIKPKDCHFGYFDINMCKKVINLLKD